MRDIAVGFLWHMHQPYYKDPITSMYLMPWVRLHSIRGYYDMITLLREYPNVRCTFNLVPSLLAQLIDYTDAGCRDGDFMYPFLRMNWRLRDIRVLVYYPSQFLIKTMKG